jgi:hypothetical protein
LKLSAAIGEFGHASASTPAVSRHPRNGYDNLRRCHKRIQKAGEVFGESAKERQISDPYHLPGTLEHQADQLQNTAWQQQDLNNGPEDKNYNLLRSFNLNEGGTYFFRGKE